MATNKKHNQSFLAQASALAITASKGMGAARQNEGKAIAMMVHGLVVAWGSPLNVVVLSKTAGEEEQTERFTCTLDDYRFPKLKENGERDKLHRGALVQAIMSQLCEVPLDDKGKAPLAAQAVFRLAYPAAAHIVASKCSTEWDAKKGTFRIIGGKGGKLAAAALTGLFEGRKGNAKKFANDCKAKAIEAGTLAKPDSRQGRAGGNPGKKGGESKGAIATREATPTDLFTMTRDILAKANESGDNAEMSFVFTPADVALVREMVEQAGLFLEAEGMAS